MSAWSVKARRTLSRHYRDERAYGHTTTAMPDMSTHTPYHSMILMAKGREEGRTRTSYRACFSAEYRAVSRKRSRGRRVRLGSNPRFPADRGRHTSRRKMRRVQYPAMGTLKNTVAGDGSLIPRPKDRAVSRRKSRGRRVR